jgi:flavin reductase (DIM6/NTAB) family NADH-FMN oxidoreductase RutF
VTTSTVVDQQLFRSLLRRHAAGVVVVTVPGSRPTGFTATSFTSVSLDPPLVSFCVANHSSAWPAVSAAAVVAVHLLGADQAPVARVFATRGIDRLAAHGAWTPGPGGVPLLDGAVARAVCRISARVPAGDHTIVVCTVESGEHRAGEHLAPLVYHAGEYLKPHTWRNR